MDVTERLWRAVHRLDALKRGRDRVNAEGLLLMRRFAAIQEAYFYQNCETCPYRRVHAAPSRVSGERNRCYHPESITHHIVPWYLDFIPDEYLHRECEYVIEYLLDAEWEWCPYRWGEHGGVTMGFVGQYQETDKRDMREEIKLAHLNFLIRAQRYTIMLLQRVFYGASAEVTPEKD